MNQWSLKRNGFCREEAIIDGNRFLCANGYMGLRGVPEEAGPDLFPAITLSGVYDQYQDKWREPVNAPRCLYVQVAFEGESCSLEDREALSHSSGIDYRRGIYSRRTDFGPVVLESSRLVSMAQPHALMDRMEITFTQAGQVTITAGISTKLWDINGPHLFGWKTQAGELLTVEALTGEKHISLCAGEVVELNRPALISREEGDGGAYQVFGFSVQKGESVILTCLAAIYTSLDVPCPAQSAVELCRELEKKGYEDCFREHCAAWEKIHRASEIEMEGDQEAVLGLHASQYHLNAIAPRHADNLSIPARGLSAQTYKGAIFWDSEIFFFPMFVYTQPEIARSLLRYRIETLPGALKKAAEYGYRGAFYAWESQEGGEEGCTNFNVVDVFTHRPVRTYFRDKQIHISGDIVYALRSYYEITGDRSLLEQGGARVILECARFYLSRAQLHADSPEIDYQDVIGPDEYHERVTNNAFTNHLIRHCLASALELEKNFSDRSEWFQALLQELHYEQDWKLLSQVKERIRFPKIKDGIIEQFDGYFALEDCSLEEVRGRLCHPKEYWGGDHGVAGTTQIIKQADVLAMMALFPGDFTREEVAANWAYYEPRTEHGSSLSACMYALTACRQGRPDLAWDLFLRTASIDITGAGKEWAGEIYIGGTHPASNGGAWMIAALGFAGLRMEKGRPEIHPNLPRQIQKLSFPIVAGGQRLRIVITPEDSSIQADS